MAPADIKLLQRVLFEIVNLTAKVNAKEDEGWEGSKRRAVLRADLQAAIDAAQPSQINETR